MAITRAERTAFGRLAIVEAEASYNAGYTGTGGEHIYLLEDAIPDTPMLSDGNRGRSWHAGGMLVPQGRGGFYGAVSLQTQASGPGVAWSASSRPNIHRLLQGCGHDAVLDATAGAESWTFARPAYPIPASDQSLAMRLYWHGLRQDLTGALGSFSFDSSGLGIPTWTFDYTGVISALDPVVDEIGTAIPVSTPIAGTFPVAQGVVINLGSYLVARVRSFKFTQTRSVVPRQDQSVANLGIAGVAGGPHSPEWELVLEAPAKSATVPTASGINPFHMRGGTPFDLKYKCYTGGDYAPYRFEIPRAYLKPDGFSQSVDEANIALWTLSGMCGLAGDGSAGDFDYRLVFPKN